MSSPYIPNRNADLLNWLATFSAGITADPSLYGLVSGDAVAIAAQSDAFAAAYALGGGTYHMPVNAATKTPATTQALSDAKIAALAVVRPYAQQIANSAGVDADDKIAIGLNPHTSTPTPIPEPVSFPVLSLVAGSPLQLTMRSRDSVLADTKAKPAGAIALQLFAKVSVTPIVDPTELDFVSQETKSPFALSFDSGDAGKIVYMASRWVTRRGLVGPWSSISSATVMAA